MTELHFSSLKIGPKGDENVQNVMKTYNGTVKTYMLCIRMSMSSLSMVMPLSELKSNKDYKLSMKLKIECTQANYSTNFLDKSDKILTKWLSS